jgi:putative thioredoxin
MDVTGQNIEQAMQISQQKPVVIKVGAEWCGPCQELAPVISGFAHDDAGKWLLGKVDGDKSPDLVDRFKVDGYPTVIGIYKGKEVGQRMIGYDGNPQSVRQWIDSILQAGGQR